MEAEKFDLAVIGAGSGGIAAANRAARHGARVVIFEPDRLGGTCVNRGCVPKKLSWLAARTAEAAGNAAGYGFKPVRIEHDFGELRAARERYVAYLNGRYAEGLDKNGVTLIRAQAHFEHAHTLVSDSVRVAAAQVLVATGAYPRPLDVPGGASALSSDDFFKLDERPARVAMIGAGYIAAELGGIFAALGSQVDMYLGGRRPLAHFDPFIGERLEAELARAGIRCRASTASRIAREGKDFVFQADDGQETAYGAVISAIGRVPNTAGLALDAAGVTRGENGAIQVNELHETNVPGVHAVGDVTGRAHALTPVAIAAGRRLADRLFGGLPARPIEPQFVPSVVFAHPPIGSVGFTEPAARERYGDGVKTYTNTFTPMASALVDDKQGAAMKLVVLGAEQRVIGLHVIGEGADELLQGFAVAIRMGATKRDFDETLAIHPTLAEEVVTLR